MRILHLYDGHERVYGGRGSVPNVVWNVARETAAAGHDVTVIERQWDGMAPTARHDDVSFERIPLGTGSTEPWGDVPYEMVKSPVGVTKLAIDRCNFAFKSVRRLREREFDVLHVHLPFAANVLLTIAPSLRRSTVYTAHLGELRLGLVGEDPRSRQTLEHDDSPPDANRPGGLTVPTIVSMVSPDRYLVKRAAKTTVLNPRIKHAFRDWGIPETDLAVIPNGVDVERFEAVDDSRVEDAREQYGLSDGPVVLFVGTIMPRKGVLDLVRALELVRETLDVPPQVILAGEPGVDESYADDVRERIVQSGLDPFVSMPGFVPEADLPALYALADVYVMPSREEGFGMTAIEALAAGTPVIATRVGGVPQVIESRRHGQLIDPGDVDGLAAGMIELLTGDSIPSDRLQRRARQFSWGVVSSSFIDVYGSVAA